RFFGRTEQASEIVSLVTSHPIVLVYAQSGAGKTSLINARLAPLLEQVGFEVLPLARVRGVMSEYLRPEHVANIYVLNVLLSWLAGPAEPAMLGALARTSVGGFLSTRARQ